MALSESGAYRWSECTLNPTGFSFLSLGANAVADGTTSAMAKPATASRRSARRATIMRTMTGLRAEQCATQSCVLPQKKGGWEPVKYISPVDLYFFLYDPAKKSPVDPRQWQFAREPGSRERFHTRCRRLFPSVEKPLSSQMLPAAAS